MAQTFFFLAGRNSQTTAVAKQIAKKVAKVVIGVECNLAQPKKAKIFREVGLFGCLFAQPPTNQPPNQPPMTSQPRRTCVSSPSMSASGTASASPSPVGSLVRQTSPNPGV